MKTIEKTKTIESKYNVYVANDGTEFNDAEECKKYEESAYGVLNMKYKELVVGETDEESLTIVGCSNNGVDIVKVKTQQDADVIMQMYFLINPHVKNGADENDTTYIGWINRAKELLKDAIEDDDYLFIGRGYADADCFWFIGTRASILAKINETVNNLNK